MGVGSNQLFFRHLCKSSAIIGCAKIFVITVNPPPISDCGDDALERRHLCYQLIIACI